MSNTILNITTGEGSTRYSVNFGDRGPAGPQGEQGIQGIQGETGPNEITTATATDLTGFIYGDGTNVAGATQATYLSDGNTLVLRDLNGESYFTAIVAEQSLNLSYNMTITTDATTARGAVFPDASGYVALTTNATGSASNIEIYAKAATTLTKGAVVYISGASGANKLISPAQASTEGLSSKTIGVTIQSLATNAFGYVMTEGDLTGLGINLGSGHGVVEGDPIWLSPTTAGGMVFGVANKPSAPDHMVFIGYVLKINGNTLDEIYVKIQNGFELQELHNVAILSPTNGQVISYNSTTGLWANTNQTITSTGISDSTLAGRTILTATDHQAQITALSNVTDTASTSITLTAADSGKILRCTASSAVTINMPSTDPAGNFSVAVIRAGTGSVTFAANGKTINSYNNALSIAGQHAWASVIRVASNTYNLSGTLA
jgi:hypothetical protein